MEKTTYTRSNAREKYGKNTKRNTSRNSKNSQETSFAETLLAQCLISSVVLLILLVICIVKTDFTANLRENIKVAIFSQTSLEDIKDTASFFDGLTEKPVEEDNADPVFNLSDEPIVDENLNEPSGVNTDSTSEPFRIDEDILNEINSQKDPYGIKK